MLARASCCGAAYVLIWLAGPQLGESRGDLLMKPLRREGVFLRKPRAKRFFPKASLMLGFCFRFSLKVPGSDTSCDDGDKKGFPFRCAADRACDAGWGCRPGVRGWLGGRRCGAGWGDGGVVQAGWGDADWAWLETARGRTRLAGNRPASETGAVDARDMRKPPASGTGADARDMRKPPASETGAVDARDMRKPPASETGAVDARDMRKPPPSKTDAVDARDMRKPPASETGAADAS